MKKIILITVVFLCGLSIFGQTTEHRLDGLWAFESNFIEGLNQTEIFILINGEDIIYIDAGNLKLSGRDKIVQVEDEYWVSRFGDISYGVDKGGRFLAFSIDPESSEKLILITNFDGDSDI